MAPVRALPTWRFQLLAVAVGAVAGLGAVVFRGLIGLFHNLFFLGQLSWAYDANVHTPAGPWGLAIALVPALGALCVAFLVQNFAPEAKGHGVPEVVDAIYYNHGVIRPVVVAVKALASALSIGSGGAVGREGPIIQIGSAFGSSVGQALPVPVWQRGVLIAAGAAGGIAATFNTPVGGVLFAIEIVMIEVSARTLVPVALATATATYVGRIFFGAHPSFVIPALEKPYFELARPEALVAFVGLGIGVGLVSVLFIRSIYAFEDFFDRMPGGYYLRHAGGMLVVGLLFTVLLHTTGHYHVQGVGYATIQDILGNRLGAGLLLALFVAKLFATAVTLGSGASGGIFSPGLFLGATLGGAYAVAANALLPDLDLHPAAFAVAGMAGVIGGSTGAAMAAIVMIFEMTLDYTVIIPITLTVAISYGVRSMLCAESIYSLKLARRGHGLPQSLRTNLHELRRASDLMQEFFVRVPATRTLDETARILAEQPAVAWFLITSGEQIEGVLTRADVLAARGERPRETPLGDVTRRDWITVRPGVRLSELVSHMHSRGVSCALVTEGPDSRAPEGVRGLITKSEIADALGQLSEIYA